MKMLARAGLALFALFACLCGPPAYGQHANTSVAPMGYAPEQACVTWSGGTIGSGTLIPCGTGSGGGSSGPAKATSTATNGTITAANSYQSVLAAAPTRNGCLIQNRSTDSLKAFLGAPGSATDATSVSIPAGGSFSCNSPGLVVTDQISLTGPTTGDAFTVVSQ
jgi:hypothetical protein